MRLGNKSIIKEKERGGVVIDPYDKGLLNACSYDITLDKYFITFIDNRQVVFDPSEDDIREVCECFEVDVITIGSFERVLARSVEKIGGANKDITSQLASRSTWGRHGLEICSCAGYGDPGYTFNWTLEIFNKNQYKVKLKRGMVLGQIFFDRVEESSILYESNYNNEEIDVFKTMLPKKIRVFLYDG